MAQIFTTSKLELRVLQTSISSFTKFVFLGSLARQDGEACSALFWKLILFVEVNAQITGIHA